MQRKADKIDLDGGVSMWELLTNITYNWLAPRLAASPTKPKSVGRSRVILIRFVPGANEKGQLYITMLFGSVPSSDERTSH